MAKSTRTSEIFLLTAKVAEQGKRIALLEQAVADLCGRIFLDLDDEMFQGLDGLYFEVRNPSESMPDPVKRGRRPRIPPDKFARRRDDLVQFIELRWPSLWEHFNDRATVAELRKALESASPGAQLMWPYAQLVIHTDVLLEFLGSGRYKGEPRQIAYAMAGLPELAWRSSLDYGTKNPSPLS